MPNCISSELMSTKLYEFGIDSSFFKNFIHFYKSQQKQRNKINTSYSIFASILYWVFKGSILGPLLFNTNICNFLFEQ